MMARSFMMVILCFGLFTIVQMFVPKVLSMKKTSNLDEFMIDDQRTHKIKNYFVQRARHNEMLGGPDNRGVAYDIESYDPEANPEELSALIVDYANMVGKDVILLDNSVETRNRKRGNLKVKKQSNQVIQDLPSSCEYEVDRQYLGDNIYPHYIETRNCSKIQQWCLPPYVCKEKLYNMTIFKKRMQFSKQDCADPYIMEEYPVSVGCICVREYDVRT